MAGAVRSVYSHFVYWRGRGGGDGGHSARLAAWTNYTTTQKRVEAASGVIEDEQRESGR